MKKLNVSLVRARNIVEIVSAISEHEGISRAEIAERAGVSVMTVSNIMEVLLRNGAVYETEQRTENVGRNPALVYFSRSKWLMVLNLAYRRLECSFLNLELIPFDTLYYDYDSAADYRENLVRFLVRIQSRIVQQSLNMQETLGISVCLPSPYKPETDTTDCPRIPEMAGLRIKETIGQFFDCTILAGADVKLAAIACTAALKEYAPHSLLYIFIDRGVSGTLLYEGNVLLGADGYAGDIGQMETASGERLEFRLLVLGAQLEALAQAQGCPIDALWELPSAQAALGGYTDTLGAAVYNTCCVASPYAVMLEGSCTRLGRRLAQRLEAYVHARLSPASRHKPTFVLLSRPVNNAITGAGMRLREKWIKELN